jgi:hypothetical protein
LSNEYLFHLKIKNMNTNSRNPKKALSLLVFMALLFMPFMSYSQSSKTDFSGNWKLNESKSKMGERGSRGEGEMSINQSGNDLTIKRSMTGRNGEIRTNSEKFTLDGIESVNEGRMGAGKSKVNFSADGKSLNFQTTRTMTRNDQSREVNTTQQWSMLDKNTLEITTTMPTPNGERTTTAVYDRK